MHKISLILIAALTLIACHQPVSKNISPVSPPDSAKAVPAPPVQNPFDLPDGFSIDSIKTNDTSRKMEVTVYLPKYTQPNEFDTIAHGYIRKLLGQFTTGVDSAVKDRLVSPDQFGSTFDARPVGVYKNKRLASYCIIIGTYTAGNAHGFDQFYSLNYDLDAKKSIKPTDYFVLNTHNDRKALLDLINHSIVRSDADRPVDTLKSLEHIQYNVEKDSVSFNFNDYDIAPYSSGPIRVKIAKEKMKTLIAPTYW